MRIPPSPSHLFCDHLNEQPALGFSAHGDAHLEEGKEMRRIEPMIFIDRLSPFQCTGEHGCPRAFVSLVPLFLVSLVKQIVDVVAAVLPRRHEDDIEAILVQLRSPKRCIVEWTRGAPFILGHRPLLALALKTNFSWSVNLTRHRSAEPQTGEWDRQPDLNETSQSVPHPVPNVSVDRRGFCLGRHHRSGASGHRFGPAAIPLLE